jgi:uncharacterized protein (DUF2235 family)
MAHHPAAAEEAPAGSPGRNIVILSDGTGQRGGVFFDEARSNIYKLFRATRIGPDSAIDPERQIAFYDPGLGTGRSPDGSPITWFRTIYNYLSQATGLGLTHNIVDCYAALIRLWRPGDRIYLFGFSRGAYTVRCLAAVIAYCGIPTRDGGHDLKRDEATSLRIAAKAVKSVYQHVSSNRDALYQGQRTALALAFRERFGSGDAQAPNAYPFFIGVFDTVAALANRGALAVVTALAVAGIAGASLLLSHAVGGSFAYWAFWIAVVLACLLIVLYVHTHLKFAFGLAGFRWWETVHLTSFKQRFYDTLLDPHVPYARHAISIDERRADFQRVPWGNRAGELGLRAGIARFVQLWFAGNHADIGGGYPEAEARLSDIALDWMAGEATTLGDESLLVDRRVLGLAPQSGGQQHDETRSFLFRLAGTSDRRLMSKAAVHESVSERFALPGVLQYDVTAPYRPEALRGHPQFADYYRDVPLPYATCRQRLRRRYRRKRGHDVQETEDGTMTAERVLSCLGLVCLLAGALGAGGIFLGQCLCWLMSGIWTDLPLDLALGGMLRSLGTGWIGLQIIFAWILKLPLSLALLLAGVFFFWLLGAIAAGRYRKRASRATPAQTHA